MFKIINYEKDIIFKTKIGEICSISLEQDFNVEEDGKINFDFDSYYRSMFVNVKCKYDKKLRKYVYYFPWDPDTQKKKMEEVEVEYAVSNDEEKRKITLNFFEPRVNKAII